MTIATQDDIRDAQSAFRARYVEFCHAASALLDAWIDVENTGSEVPVTYPRYLPSFDEFIADMRAALHPTT